MNVLKKNGTQWILFVAVLGVWGTIVMRLIGLTGSGTKNEIPVRDRGTIPARTEVALLLNYRDPFLKDSPISPRAVKTPKRRVIPSRQELSPPGFRLLGKIRKGKKDFLLVVSGEEQRLVASTDKIDGFSVCTVFTDSVIVRKGDKRYTIIMEQE